MTNCGTINKFNFHRILLLSGFLGLLLITLVFILIVPSSQVHNGDDTLASFKTSTGLKISVKGSSESRGPYLIFLEKEEIWPIYEREEPLMDDVFLGASYREIELKDELYAMVTIHDVSLGSGVYETKTVFVFDLPLKRYCFYFVEYEYKKMGITESHSSYASLDAILREEGQGFFRIAYFDIPHRECLVGLDVVFSFQFGYRTYRKMIDGSFKQVENVQYTVVDENSGALVFDDSPNWQQTAEISLTAVPEEERSGVRSEILRYQAQLTSMNDLCTSNIPKIIGRKLGEVFTFIAGNLMQCD